ncbi:hypothetical protein BDN70DRAFT_383950 [Pholiota conissans]|uniref:Uncharacterized protein n=1 Tax=Pholiota conissans TaxID=109636 RepID=A0A9P6CUQ9_9AGAR|nr:hypothetical protein BDN70DRAFT_383950 [Pholiota conissans]
MSRFYCYSYWVFVLITTPTSVFGASESSVRKSKVECKDVLVVKERNGTFTYCTYGDIPWQTLILSTDYTALMCSLIYYLSCKQYSVYYILVCPSTDI